MQHIAGNLNVNGRLQILRTVNGLQPQRLCEFCGQSADKAPSEYALHVLGDAEFEEAEPFVGQLNGWQLNDLLPNVWMTNEPNAVLTGGGSIQMANVEVTHGIRLNGVSAYIHTLSHIKVQLYNNNNTDLIVVVAFDFLGRPPQWQIRRLIAR